MQYLKAFRTPFLISVVMIVMCGLIYPLITTGLAQLLFPHQANGNLIEVNGKAVGSEWVGQLFTDPRFMRSRPSAVYYNVYSNEEKENGRYEGVRSGSANYGSSNPDLEARAAEDFVEFIKANMDADDIPPVLLKVTDTFFDPYIVQDDALKQIPALVKSTGLSEGELVQIIDENSAGKINGTPSSVIFETRYRNGTLSEDQIQKVRDVLAASDGKIMIVSKVNLDIFKRINKININIEDMPADLLTASGSGLDPHISPAAARVQIPALVKNTGLPAETLLGIVERNTSGKVLGIFGEDRVNVLKVNIEIAKLLGIV